MTRYPALDLVVVGNAVIDRIHRVTLLPKRDSSAFVLDEYAAPGGVEANVAAAAAQFGLRVGAIARVGSDRDGQLVLEDLRERGVDTARVQVGDERDTAYSLIFVDGDGDRIIMTGGQGVRRLHLDNADDRYIQQARVCFTSAYLPWRLLERVAAVCAKPDGPAFAFDLPDAFEDLAARGLARENVHQILAGIDLFLTNRESLRSFTGQPEIADGIDWLCRHGVRRISVSDGSNGLYVRDATGDDRSIERVRAFPLKIVDTSGAGDVLHAALISEWLLNNRPAPDAGRIAAAAAALSCQGWGVRAALPTRDEAVSLASTGFVESHDR